MLRIRFSQIALKKQLIFLFIFCALPALAQEVPGTVTFHTPEDQTKDPILETPFRKPEVIPPEKPKLPKVNSPVVPGGDAEKKQPEEEKPNHRPLASQRRPVLPPLGMELLGVEAPKEVPEGRKPVSLIDASPIVFSQSEIAIYPWVEKEEYFEDDPKKIIRLRARILRDERVVLPDNLSKVKFMEDNGVLTIFPRAQITTIPLEHIYFAQDILFLDDEGIVRQMVYKTEVRSPKPVVSKTEVRSVLQLNAGSIHKFNLKIGDKIAIPPQI